MPKIDKNKLMEMHRTQLKQALLELLERADEIVDTTYNNQTTNVNINIEIEPCEIITYSINYNCFAKNREIFKKT
jgi:hypothetical protein